MLNLKEVKQHARELERTTLRVKSMECLVVLILHVGGNPIGGVKTSTNSLINGSVSKGGDYISLPRTTRLMMQRDKY